MTRYQRAKRAALLRGSAIAISVLVFLMLLSALADRVTQ
jgi:hypothetical protein